MRRRDRMEGHIWLKWVNHESCKNVRYVVAAELRAIDDCMADLVSHHGLMVVCDRDGDLFSVRCYPAINARIRGLPYWAASYSGTDLRTVLSAAAYEYKAAQDHEAPYDVSASEVARWIA